MTLPTTISALSTTFAPVGPFKQSNTTSNLAIASLGTALTWGTPTAPRVGMSFTTQSGGGSVSVIAVNLKKTGTPADNISISLYAVDGSGLPTGTALGTSANVVGSTLTTTLAGTSFTFGTAVTLAANTKYVFVISRSGSLSGTDYYSIAYGDPGGGYPYGSAVYQDSGLAWTDLAPATLTCTIAGVTTTLDYYYIFGAVAGAEDNLYAAKSLQPDTSWGGAFRSGFTTAIRHLSAHQAGSIIHLIITDGASATSTNKKYNTFNMSVDVFVTNETIVSGEDTTTSAGAATYEASVTVRSGGEVVVIANSPRVSTFSQVSYYRRTGTATWTSATAVSTAGTNCTNPLVSLGASDRLHFLWHDGTNTNQRHLTSANVLGTSASTGTTQSPLSVARYDAGGGTIKHVAVTSADALRWTSADNPTVSRTSVTFGSSARVTSDSSGNFYGVYQNSADSDLYIRSSLDSGATFGAALKIYTGTAPSSNIAIGKSANIYTRGSAVFPFAVNDTSVGAWRYSERGIPLPLSYTLAAATGTLTLTGQDAALVKFTPVRTIVAGVGTISLTGRTVTLQLTRRVTAGQGVLTLTGKPAILLKFGDKALLANYGAITLTGKPVALARSSQMMSVVSGTIIMYGQTVTLDADIAPPPDPDAGVIHYGRRRRNLLGPWVMR